MKKVVSVNENLKREGHDMKAKKILRVYTQHLVLSHRPQNNKSRFCLLENVNRSLFLFFFLNGGAPFRWENIFKLEEDEND